MTNPSDGGVRPPDGQPAPTTPADAAPPPNAPPAAQPAPPDGPPTAGAAQTGADDDATAQLPRIPASPLEPPHPAEPPRPVAPSTAPTPPPWSDPTSAPPAAASTPPGQPFPAPLASGPPAHPTSGQPYPGAPASGPPAYPAAPVSGQPYPGAPTSGQPYGAPVPGQFGAPPPPGPGFLAGQPAPPPGPGSPAGQPAPPRKRRGLMIASLVLAVVLLLCAVGGVGAFLVLRQAETGEGAAEPVAAVESFLRAVYHDRDARKAASLVCSEARDDTEITKKVNEIKGYASRYKSPRFRWDSPKVDDQNDERAIVSAKVTMITADEKTSDLPLRFTVVQKTGWWICEVD